MLANEGLSQVECTDRRPTSLPQDARRLSDGRASEKAASAGAREHLQWVDTGDGRRREGLDAADVGDGREGLVALESKGEIRPDVGCRKRGGK